MRRSRRVAEAVNTALPTTTQGSSELPPLLRKLMADYAATGLPPAYLPKTNQQEIDL